MGESVGGGGRLGPLTARDVFSDDPAALVAVIEAAVSEDGLVDGLPSDASAGTSKAVLAQAAKAIDELLGQLRLDDLLMGGWMQLSDLQAAVEETAVDGSSRHVALKQHTISSDHEPSLDLVVNQVTKTLMQVEIHLRLEVAACELVVAAGEVTGVEVGSLVAAGDVAAAGQPILERTTGRLDAKRLFAAAPAPTP